MRENVPDPCRVAVDADVLAADMFVGGSSREAMDLLRSHSWLEVIATPALLADAEWLIEQFGTKELAGDWRRQMNNEVKIVKPTAQGHPALVAAAAGNAASVLSLNETLQQASVGASIRTRVQTSVKSPAAFVELIDPATLFETVTTESYPGPDRDPRS